jgi:hypothetical protein
MAPEDYDNSGDDGTYEGVANVYTGPGTDDADIKKRVCPVITITLTINGDTSTLRTQDNYPDYSHHPSVVTDHRASLNLFGNNQFTTSDSWVIEESDVQLSDLQTLEVCDSTPQSDPLDPSTGDRGNIYRLGLEVSNSAHVGEYGGGKARGNIIYGVRCRDDSFIPVCVYFMNLTKTQ